MIKKKEFEFSLYAKSLISYIIGMKFEKNKKIDWKNWSKKYHLIIIKKSLKIYKKNDKKYTNLK